MRFQTWQIAMPCGLVIALACGDSALTGQRLTIGQLQKYLAFGDRRWESGRDAAFRPIRERTKSCYTLYGRAKFALVDDTGSLPVESVGSCYCYPAAQDLPHDGDQIEFTVMIHLNVPEGQTTQVMKGITQEIIILE